MSDTDSVERRSDDGAMAEGPRKMTRREFLPGAILGGGLLAAGGLYLYKRSEKAISGQARESASSIREAQRALREVDPKLIEYEQVGRIDTGLTEPRQITLAPDGSLYVAGDRTMRIFDPSGAPRAEMPLAADPHCLAVDDSGTVYVGFRDHVEVYGPGGELRARWPSLGERAYLTCLALSGDDVWVADAGSRVVLRCDSSGCLLGRIGEKDESREIPGLVLPGPHLDVVVAPDGLLLVNNSGRWTVETYTAEGELRSSWGRASQGIEGFCGCCNPTDIALFPDGRVATSEKGLPRVKVYSPDGTLECVVAAPDDLSVNPAGTVGCEGAGLDLAIDSEGRLLVLDPCARAVRVFARRDSAGPQEVRS
ncbi:MAG: NHL repeat-containing protein [Armatimonadota bacterium]